MTRAGLQERLRGQWVEAAQEWIESDRAVREGMLDSWMLDALGDVRGKRAIDIGCGEGRFSRVLADLGAVVTGVDLTKPLLQRAQGLRRGNETYLLADVENMPEVDGGSFDLAVSYIVLVDLLDYRKAIAEAHRVLRPGGRFVVCNVTRCAPRTCGAAGSSRATRNSSTRWTSTRTKAPGSLPGWAASSSTCTGPSPATYRRFWKRVSLSTASPNPSRPKSSSPLTHTSTTSSAPPTS